MSFTEAFVKTGDYPFYEASQKMYKSCGFEEVQRYATSSDPRHGSIEYYIALNNYLVNPVNPV